MLPKVRLLLTVQIDITTVVKTTENKKTKRAGGHLLAVCKKLMNLLFVCSENKLRSATAESVFSNYPGFKAIGAGTNKDANTPVSGDLIEWADVVFVMEPIHKQKLVKKFSELLKNKKLTVLAIPDNYKYMDSELIQRLKESVKTHIQI